MSTHHGLPNGPANSISDVELRHLELLWAQGHLLERYDVLKKFVRREAPHILAECHLPKNDADLLQAIKQRITEQKIVDPVTEARDQKKVIQDEIWFSGERGIKDRVAVSLAWTQSHAPHWRNWRIKEYLFVTDHCAEHLLKCIRQTG